MFLSRVKINPVRRDAVRLLTNPRAMHAAVEAAFPDPDHGRVLWRTDAHEHRVDLLVVSVPRPDLTHLVEQAGWETAPAEVKDYDAHLARLTAGLPVAFKLRANPSRRVRGEDGKQRTFGHVTASQQLAWFRARSTGWGLEVSEDALQVSGRESRVASRRGEPAVTHAAAVFTGRAVVADPDALRTAMVAGVGRGKAYGLGLLTVVPT